MAEILSFEHRSVPFKVMGSDTDWFAVLETPIGGMPINASSKDDAVKGMQAHIDLMLDSKRAADGTNTNPHP